MAQLLRIAFESKLTAAQSSNDTQRPLQLAVSRAMDSQRGMVEFSVSARFTAFGLAALVHRCAVVLESTHYTGAPQSLGCPAKCVVFTAN